jgi:hypothetical protein
MSLCAAQPPAAPPKPAYVYSGKPIQLEHACGTKEIEELGMVCTEEESCPVFLEISGLESAGVKIFAAGTFHTSTATLASLLLISEDEGKSWREGHARLPSMLLDQVQFVDFQTGFVSGNIAGSLARDPFFLKTEDGGKTWRRISVFEDGGYGVVGSFRFESPTRGTLTIEATRGRGGLRRMETMTGGESWMTKEVLSDKPPNVRATGSPATAAAAWRVRGDTAAKALRIERRSGQRWEAVALFSLRAGACKPDPPEPPKQ